MERTPGTGWGDGKDRPPNRLRRPCRSLTAVQGGRARIASAPAVEFRILGPLEVRAGGQRGAGARRQAARGARAAAPACQPARRRRPARAGAVGRGRARRRGCKTVQVHVSRLRKALGDGAVLATTAAGYELRVEPGELDAQRFEAGVAAGRARARGRALRAPRRRRSRRRSPMWRGPPLADLAVRAVRRSARSRGSRSCASAAREELVEARARARPPRRGGRRARGADRRAPVPRAACGRS